MTQSHDVPDKTHALESESERELRLKKEAEDFIDSIYVVIDRKYPGQLDRNKIAEPTKDIEKGGTPKLLANKWPPLRLRQTVSGVGRNQILKSEFAPTHGGSELAVSFEEARQLPEAKTEGAVNYLKRLLESKIEQSVEFIKAGEKEQETYGNRPLVQGQQKIGEIVHDERKKLELLREFFHAQFPDNLKS